MKKAKIMLTAIALVTVVAAAFAFKAKTYGTGNVFTKGSGTGCQVMNLNAFADDSGTFIDGTTTSTTSACPRIKAVIVD